MSQVTEQQVLDALRQIKDPDLHKDIVTLGFIKDLKIEDHQILWSFENKDGVRQYHAKIAGSQIQGQMTGAGGPIDFAGYRAPNIRDHDDATWLKSAPDSCTGVSRRVAAT